MCIRDSHPDTRYADVDFDQEPAAQMGAPQVAAQEPGLARDSGPNRIRVEDGRAARADGVGGARAADPSHAGALWNALHTGVSDWWGATCLLYTSDAADERSSVD